MSLLDTQNFLARIYTDAQLRREFFSSPEKIGRENHLTEKEIREFVEILPVELNFFAESLLWKRLREVEKLLPVTRKLLAADFENEFREFASRFTPVSIKKHLEDAVEFCRFLQSKRLAPDWAKDAAKFERARLEFNVYEKPFVFTIFDYDIREILRQDDKVAQDELKRRKTVAVWLRVGKKTRHFIL